MAYFLIHSTSPQKGTSFHCLSGFLNLCMPNIWGQIALGVYVWWEMSSRIFSSPLRLLNSGKVSTCPHRRCKRCGFYPWVRKIPRRRAWQPTPVFLPGESHGQRSLASMGSQSMGSQRVGHD